MDGNLTGAPWRLDSMASQTELGEDECWSLLGSRAVGRVAFSAAGAVHIYPVNYAVRDTSLYFRTSPYGVVGAALHHQQVAFEVDDVDYITRSGWSVLAHGDASWVVDAAELEAVAEVDALKPWAEGTRTMYIGIKPQRLSGQRISSSEYDRKTSSDPSPYSDARVLRSSRFQYTQSRRSVET